MKRLTPAVLGWPPSLPDWTLAQDIKPCQRSTQSKNYLKRRKTPLISVLREFFRPRSWPSGGLPRGAFPRRACPLSLTRSAPAPFAAWVSPYTQDSTCVGANQAGARSFRLRQDSFSECLPVARCVYECNTRLFPDVLEKYYVHVRSVNNTSTSPPRLLPLQC